MGLNAGWPSNRSSMDLLKMLKEEIPNALMDWFVTIKSKKNKTKQNYSNKNAMGKNLQMPFRMVDVVAIILVTQMMYL
jgi:hypothetical protein